MTTHVCHAKEKVAFAGWTPVEQVNDPRFSAANGPYIPLTTAVFPKKRQALENLRKADRWVDESYNFV